MKNNIHWFLAIAIAMAGAFALYYLNYSQNQIGLENRQLKLTQTHNRAISQFSNSIDKFASVVAGMHAYVNLSDQMPDAKKLQVYVNQQLDDINYEDSIVVSFIDTTHTFQYTFTKTQLDPANLTGRKVGTLRDTAEINRLNRLMTHDSLRLLYPINLVEGWVGIPINFRVHRKGQTLGYIAPLINFKSIIQSIYEDKTSEDYAFRFSTDKGNFDREVFYDGSKIYNRSQDEEYYQNFEIDSADFLYSNVNFYGQTFIVGTAYKEQFKPDGTLQRVIWGWLATFVLFIVAISWQITRYKKVNRELKLLDDTKNKFFSIIGHDIKGPLNSIKGLLDILKFEEINDPRLNKLIADLSDATSNTHSLLDNLLTWARSQTGELKFSPGKFILSEAIVEEVQQLHLLAKEKNIVITENLDPSISIEADKNMIKTVIRNLVSNGIKYTDSKGLGEVTITTRKKNKRNVEIVISDNGIGMNHQTINDLFTLDKHISQMGTSGEMGTGLGLTLSKEFIDQHKGSIEVNSTLERGTTFTITLPMNKKSK
ncbi:MAG: HAMP domain-containing sensor histidine kinase [Fulvivirga sp.]